MRAVVVDVLFEVFPLIRTPTGTASKLERMQKEIDELRKGRAEDKKKIFMLELDKELLEKVAVEFKGRLGSCTRAAPQLRPVGLCLCLMCSCRKV
jgi:hypothetical protein